MNCARIFSIGLFTVAFCFPATTLSKLKGTSGDFEYSFSGLYRPESFYGKNISLLNNNNCDVDKVWYTRHTFDLKLDVEYAKERCGHPAVELHTTVRNRAIWGDLTSIAATSDATFKLGEAVLGAHRHTLPRHIFWIREGWLKFDVGDAVGLDNFSGHTFTLGAFPFELGLGISLGSAFAVGPEPLGFYTESSIDQYAFGAKVSGDVSESLAYDLYTAILDSKTGSASLVGAKIRGQEFGRLENPARGFGKINFLIAGRLNWYLFKNATSSCRLESYALFNHESEQKIEFRGDATSRLGTIGFSGELESDRGGVVFDCALNYGRQRVKGWDRNQIEVKGDENGKLCFLNSHVVDRAPIKADGTDDKEAKKASFRTNNTCTFQIDGKTSTVSDDTQSLINMAYQDESQNGQRIGTSRCGFELYNATDRFRNPYCNRFGGGMFVCDGYFKPFACADLKVCAAVGYATGDDNPNVAPFIDGDFKGFIGLQELYSGKRVRSIFTLGGSGRIKRPLSQRDFSPRPGTFERTITGFTNIAYAGTAVQWKHSFCGKEFVVHPNIIGYWVDRPTRKFDAKTGMSIDEKADNHFGTEANLITHYHFFDSMKVFFVVSCFVPGQFFTDIKGKPLSKDDQAFLDRLDKTGFTEDRIPNVGDDFAYTMNIGLEFKF